MVDLQLNVIMSVSALLAVSHYQLSYSFIQTLIYLTFLSSYPMSGFLLNIRYIVMMPKIESASMGLMV